MFGIGKERPKPEVHRSRKTISRGDFISQGVILMEVAGIAFLMSRLLPPELRDLVLGKPIQNLTGRCESGRKQVLQAEQSANSPNLGYRIAGTDAEIGLNTPNLCEGDRDRLQQIKAQAGLEIIFGNKHKPDNNISQESDVREYELWKADMKRLNIPQENRPGRWVIAQRAYDVDKFLLAKTVLEEAGLHEELKKINLEGVLFVYATLRNLGFWFTRDRNDPTYQKGLQNLLAADEISKRYSLRGAAYADLVDLLGKNEREWPKPTEEVLLLPGILPEPKRPVSQG